MPTPSFCYEAMKSKSHIVSENRECNTDPFVFPPIGPNNSHLTVAAWWPVICAEKKMISNEEFRKKDFKVWRKWKTLAILIQHLMQHEPYTNNKTLPQVGSHTISCGITNLPSNLSFFICPSDLNPPYCFKRVLLPCIFNILIIITIAHKYWDDHQNRKSFSKWW